VSSALLLGRNPATLDPAQDATDALFAAVRADGETFSDRKYSHCTFANVSFKDAKFENCEFLDCAFLDCYFRNTTISSTKLTGCKFVDCTLTDLVFVDPDFWFPTFRGCFIPYKDIEGQLPKDPGLCFKMADELAREAAASGVGGGKDARDYRLAAANAYERHLFHIALAVGSDYYKHFDGRTRRAKGRSWAWRKINRAVWGYGETGSVLGRSFALVGALIFPVAFWLFFRDSLTLSDGVPLGFFDYELFSFDNLLAGTGFSGVTFSGTATRTFVGVEVLVGLVFIGLFISLILNWMRRR
jgi:hypothetical protein